MGGWHIAAAVCSLVSFILLLAALGSPHWLELINGNAGLWEVCADSPTGKVCAGLGMDVPGFTHATRAFMIMAVFPGSISCASLFLLFYRSEIGSYSIQLMAMFSSYIAGVLILIAMAVFTGSWGSSIVYGWSVFSGWVSVILFPLAARLARRISAYTPL